MHTSGYSQQNTSYLYRASDVALNDVLLDAPVPSSPANRSVSCLGNGDTFDFTWGVVGSATGYVLQWCQNTQFSGPTLKSINVGNVTTYSLTVGSDIWIAQPYYWRVFAYSTNGGASPKSEPWELKVECPEDEGGESKTPECSDVTITLTPPAQQSCEEGVCTDVSVSWGSPGTSYVSHSWSISGVGQIATSSQTTACVTIDPPVEGSVTLTYSVTLNSGGSNYTCEQSTTYPVYCECGTAGYYITGYHFNIASFYVGSGDSGLYICYTNDYIYTNPCWTVYTTSGYEQCAQVGTYECAPVIV